MGWFDADQAMLGLLAGYGLLSLLVKLVFMLLRELFDAYYSFREWLKQRRRQAL